MCLKSVQPWKKYHRRKPEKKNLTSLTVQFLTNGSVRQPPFNSRVRVRGPVASEKRKSCFSCLKRSVVVPGSMSGQWSREATSVLIELYRQHPCLYDDSSDGYNCRTVRQEALDAILSGVMPLKPDTSVTDIRQRINVLRTQFSLEYRRCRSNLDQSSGTISSVNLWCFSDLYFLRDHIGPCKRLRGPEAPRSVEPSPEVRSDTPRRLRGSAQSRAADVCEVETFPVVHVNGTVDSDDTEYPCSLQSRKRKLHDAIDSEFVRKTGDALVAIQNELTSISCQTAASTKTEDKWDIFGNFVASELRSLEQEHLQSELKKKIMLDIIDFQ